MLRFLVAPRVDLYLPFLVSHEGRSQSLIVLRLIAKRGRKSSKHGKQATHIIIKGMHMLCASVVDMISGKKALSMSKGIYKHGICISAVTWHTCVK